MAGDATIRLVSALRLRRRERCADAQHVLLSRFDFCDSLLVRLAGDEHAMSYYDQDGGLSRI